MANIIFNAFALASAEYKAAEAEYLNGLAEWANGKQERRKETSNETN